MNSKENFIIDVDAGIDDALAMILAYKTIGKQILGITTCGGNVRLEDATNNVLKMLSLINWDIPVYSGAAKSTTGNEFVHAYDYHGANGLCDIQLSTNKKVEKLGAVDFIIESAKKNTAINVICLATPTNLAQAIEKDPKIVDKINKVYLMGGAINVPGNQTEYAEYNFFQDPKAVEIVLKNVKDCYIVPLDVTNQCVVSDKLASAIKDDSKTSRFVKEAIINWYRFFGYPKKRQFELYDPLTITAAAGLNYLNFSNVKIGINAQGLREGEIFINGKYKAKLAQVVKSEEFVDFFLKSVK